MKNLTQLYQKYLPFYQKYFGLVFRISLMIILIFLYYEFSYNFYTCTSYNGDYAKEWNCYLRASFRDLEPLIIFLAVSYVLFWFTKKDR